MTSPTYKTRYLTTTRWTPSFSYDYSSGVEVRTPVTIVSSDYSVVDRVPSIWSAKASVKTPGYREKRRARIPLPDNRFSYERTVIDYGRFVTFENYGPQWPRVQKVYDGSPTASTVEPLMQDDSRVLSTKVGLYSRAQSRARGSLWNAPVFVAEAGKTALMAANRAHHLAVLANHLRRGDLVSFVSNLASEPTSRQFSRYKRQFDRTRERDPGKAAANAWLEYTYGWVPFMSDVQTALNTFSDLAEKEAGIVRTLRLTSKGTYTESRTAQTTFEGRVIDSNWTETFGWSYRMVWHYKRVSSIPASLGLTNPAAVVWELVPFSFVADWFLPIGDYFQQLDLSCSVQHVGGTLGFRSASKIDRVSYLSRSKTFSVGGTYQSEKFVLERYPITTSPAISASEVLRSASLDGLVEKGRRITSAASLLRQQVSRFRK